MIEYKAVQKSISIDYESGKKLITFMVDNASDQSIEACRGKDLRINVRQWKNKRSLDANGYYWKLLGNLADKLRMSTTELHNRMLMEWGQIEMMDGHPVLVELPEGPETEKMVLSSTTYHLKPTTDVFRKMGSTKRTWLMLRGSHTYNTAEFSRLLNGLIEECKLQGIPTDTPDQIAALMAAYKETHG